ncbi:hypothetical protein T265_08344 [Opisthorchis viverrini]|uniref:Uncharacterized protein n=1 Tax=Opisthorchis viverrini TaxID=6198 RepID=A0A074Z9H1_OPIVI|nr:hypothetical protein T265_08344 [Opisthorchis viverrini]KER23881.1 hypothetical protein T265_08344 [Opisthorchis viverrini]
MVNSTVPASAASGTIKMYTSALIYLAGLEQQELQTDEAIDKADIGEKKKAFDPELFIRKC